MCATLLERAQLLSGLPDEDVGDALVSPAATRRFAVEGELEPWQKTSKIFKIHGPNDGGSCVNPRLPPVFAPFCRSEKLLDVLTDVLDTPDITCFLSQFIFKDGVHDNVKVTTKDGSTKRTSLSGSIGQPFHQDTFYWQDMTNHRQVGCWIALSDATIENGCLWVVPGSQLEDIHSVGADPRPNSQLGYVEIFDFFKGQEDVPMGMRKEVVPVLMKKGDVLFFDANIIHGSTDNTSASPRCTMLYHFTPSSTRMPPFVPINWDVIEVQTARDRSRRQSKL
jgi:hypothetical protein